MPGNDVIELFMSAWMELKTVQSFKQPVSKTASIPISGKGTNPVNATQKDSLSSKTSKDYEAFVTKIEERLTGYSAVKDFTKELQVCFFKTATQAWNDAYLEKFLSDSISSQGLKGVCPEGVNKVTPLLAWSPQATSSAGLVQQKENKPKDAMDDELAIGPQPLKEDPLQSLPDPLDWVKPELIEATLHSIDKSIVKSKGGWQCLSDFVVYVVEVVFTLI